MAPSQDSVRTRREAVVRRHIDAEKHGDLDRIVASFHRPRYDVVPMGSVSEGEAAVRELVRGLVTAFPDFCFQPSAIHHADRAVIVEGRMTGTHRAAWAGLEPKGAKLDLRAACVFDFDEDRLFNETVYFDFAALQGQLSSP